MKPSDIQALVTLNDPVVSPDGRTVAFVVTRSNAQSDGYRSQIWLATADGSSAPRPFTAGEQQDGCPAWAPDGSQLAFTSRRGDNGSATIHLAPVDSGGEIITLAELPESVNGLIWSPDGRQIAFSTRTRTARYDSDHPKAQPPRRIERVRSRLDSEGFVADRPEHVYVVPTDGSATPRNLTPGEYEFGEPRWAPDSSMLVVSGAAHESWDLDFRRDVFTIDLDTCECRPLVRTPGKYAAPSVSPDGTRVAFLGTEDHETYPRNLHVGVVDISEGQHRWVSNELDRTYAPGRFRAPHWMNNSTLIVRAEDRGNIHLYRVAADGAEPPQGLWTGEGCVTGFDHASGVTAFTLSTPTSPGELYVLHRGAARPLTNLSGSFISTARPRPYQHFLVPSRDGAVELDAWMLTPPGHDAGRSYPALLNVHGGPFGQYSNGFLDEFQMQARAGYVVIWCNPRGSSGREESFARAICGEPLGGTGWGSVDFHDVMAVLDHAVHTYPFIDADRVGIVGGSYGGYMSTWAVGHTDRFRAACSERAVNDLSSIESSTDIAGFTRSWIGKTHLEAPDLYQAMSPITYVHNIRTPMLILHSEDDLRCPVVQADQLFVALRMLGREVEYHRFPAEGHEMSRSGSPIHRRMRAEIILAFFGRHLNPTPEEPLRPTR